MAEHRYKHTSRGRYGYVPIALHTLTFAIFAIVCLLCIGGLEYFIHLKELKDYGAGVSDLMKRDAGILSSDSSRVRIPLLPRRAVKSLLRRQVTNNTTNQLLPASSQAPSPGATEEPDVIIDLAELTILPGVTIPPIVSIPPVVITFPTVTPPAPSATQPAPSPEESDVIILPEELSTPPIVVPPPTTTANPPPGTTANPPPQSTAAPPPQTTANPPPVSNNPPVTTAVPDPVVSPSDPPPATSNVVPLPSDILGDEPDVIILPEEIPIQTVIAPGNTQPAVSQPVVSNPPPNTKPTTMVIPPVTIPGKTTSPGKTVVTTQPVPTAAPIIVKPVPVTIPPSTQVTMAPTVINIPSTVVTSRTIDLPNGSKSVQVQTSVAMVPVTTSVPVTNVIPARTTNVAAVSGWTQLVTMRDPAGGTALITSKATILAGPGGKQGGIITRIITGSNGRLTEALEVTVVETSVVGEHTTYFSRTMFIVPPEVTPASDGPRPALGRGPNNDGNFKHKTSRLPSTWIKKMPSAEFMAQAMMMFVTIILALVWRPIDLEFKRMELWYALSNPDYWITGKDLMMTDLTFTNSFAAPFLAAKKKQWIVALSAFIYAPMIPILQLLASSTLLISAEGICDNKDEKVLCGAYVSIRPNLARVQQGILAIMAVCVVIIAILQRLRQKSLLLCHNPNTIAGLAVLMTELEELGVLGGSEATRSEFQLKQKVEDVRFRLGEVVHPDTSSKSILETLRVGEQRPVTGDDGGPLVGPRDKRPLMSRWPAIVALAAVAVTTLIFVFVYRFKEDGSGFSKFLDFSGVGPRVFCVALGIMMLSLWEPIYIEALTLEPYRLLKLRHRAPSTLTHDFLCHPFPSLLPPLYPLALALTTLCLHTLILLLSTIPFSPGSTTQTWSALTLTTILLLCLLLSCLLLITFRRHRDKKLLPRSPYSLGMKMSYLYASRMLRSFFDIAWDVSAARHPNLVLKKRVAAECRTYGLGWTVATDGVVRVAVDEEDLMADWVAGQEMELPAGSDTDGDSEDGRSECGVGGRRTPARLQVKIGSDGLRRLRDGGGLKFGMGWHRRRSSGATAGTESTEEDDDPDDMDPHGLMGEGGGRLEVVVEGSEGSELDAGSVNGASVVGREREEEVGQAMTQRNTQGEIGFMWMGMGAARASGSGISLRDSGGIYGTPVTTPGSTVGSRVALMG